MKILFLNPPDINKISEIGAANYLYKTRKNNDLFYLSGIDQEETILVLYPDAYKEENRAILLSRKRMTILKFGMEIN